MCFSDYIRYNENILIYFIGKSEKRQEIWPLLFELFKLLASFKPATS